MNYNKPVIENVTGMMENVDMASGITVNGNAEAWAGWKNHNSGSHSVLSVQGISNKGNGHTNKVEGTITYKGKGDIMIYTANPTDGRSWNLNVSMFGKVIFFSGEINSNGNGQEKNEIGIGSFAFSFDNGETWTAYDPNGGNGWTFNEYTSACRDLFDVSIRYYN